ncbi:MAG: hypothetical protein RLZZ326_3603 [Planctomycetota bacterium]
MATTPPDRFDPCRAWLGIDRADLADPRRVLGLVPGETDPIVVLKAAETRLKALKGLAAGQHHAAREGLILQVEQAREKVLSQIAAAGGAEGPRKPATAGGGYAMPPPPRRPDTPEPDGPATVLFPSTVHAEDPGHARPATDATPLVRVRPRRPVRRQGNAAIWLSLLAILASVAAGTGFIWWQSKQEGLRQAARQQMAKRSPEEGEATDDRRGAGPKPLPADAAISSSAPPPPMRKPVASPAPKPSMPSKTPSPTTVAAVESGTPADTGMGDDRAPTAPTSAPLNDEADPESEPSTDDVAAGEAGANAMTDDAMTDDAMTDDAMTDDAMTDDPMTDDAMTDDPMTDDAMTDDATADDATADDATADNLAAADPPAEDAEGEGEIEGAVTGALAALRQGDFDTADALLASALEGGRNLPAKRHVSDWQTLAQYAREFAGFREKAIAAVKPGDEYDVNGKKVAVVEIDDKKFIYRFQGRNKTTPRNKIPSGITMAIVTTWFDERPANHLFLGAYHATKPEPDLAKARDHWERAEKGGINAEPLLRLLDDSALQEGAKASEPTDE